MPTPSERKEQNREDDANRKSGQGDRSGAQYAEGKAPDSSQPKGQPVNTPSQPPGAATSVPESDHLLPGKGQDLSAARTGPLSGKPGASDTGSKNDKSR
jgi:hypothetical protein